jgi:3-hexulose-6-phosphate synthase
MTKLQVAVDLLTTADALALTNKVAPYVDIIELGTPLIKNAGLSVVSAIKAAHPHLEVFADLKTADAGFLEADLAFAAGADLVTVLGSAGDATIMGAVEAGRKHGKKVVADLIGVKDRVERAREVTKLGVAFVEIHAGLDEQAQPGYSIDNLLDDGRIAGVPFSVAGGVKIDTIAAVREAGADVAVAGGAIYSAEDPAAAAKALKDALTSNRGAAPVLRQLGEAFAAGDWSTLRQTVTDDVVYVDISSGSEVSRGADSFVRGDQDWRNAFSDFEIEILSIVGDSTHAAGDFILRGIHSGPMPTPWGDIAATGRRVELPFAMFCEVKGGRVTMVRDHYNPTLAMSQIGVDPNKL